jgi:uncharacterized membrane protein YhhN
MDLILYGSIFWIAAIAFTVLEATKRKGSPTATILKCIPAFSAVVFILLDVPSSSLFYPLLAIALVLCGLGDIAMEYNILPGLGMFLFAHLFFISNFVLHSSLGTNPWLVSAFGICLAIMVVYIITYHRYLLTASTPTPLLNAVDVYALAISLTLSTSLLLWLSTGVLLGYLPFVGTVFFVLSDSLIGIREFHHRFRYDEPATMITYYLAIFLLSLAVVVYPF